jgi:hypothetical protein
MKYFIKTAEKAVEDYGQLARNTAAKRALQEIPYKERSFINKGG